MVEIIKVIIKWKKYPLLRYMHQHQLYAHMNIIIKENVVLSLFATSNMKQLC